MNAMFETAGLTVFERGWLSSNNILFDKGDTGESVLVDSGYWIHADQTLALVNNALAGRSLDRLINTHLHSDHCGGNSELQRAFDCAIDVPSGEAGKVDRWDEDALTYRATGQGCPRFYRSGLIRAGSEIALGNGHWQVIAAPGHDPQSIILYEPEFEILISADALWENGFGVVFPELEGVRAFDEVSQTLDLISRLRISWVIPGHGAPFTSASASLDKANRRLASFIEDPKRHARYGAKVLIKFHFLEIGSEDISDLKQWLECTSYFRLIHKEHFPHSEFFDWCEILIEELIYSGALNRTGTTINNQ